jgi:hypothetical protein
MALELLVEKDSISADCGTIVYKDNTGSYDVTTNPTGYGAPNETRANLYIKFFLTLKKTVGDEQITLPTYISNTVTQWSVTVTEDGYYEAYMFATIAYAGGTTYGLSHVIYDIATDTFYKSLSAGNTGNAVTDATWWEAVTDVDELKAAITASQPDAYADVYEHIELCNSRICKTKAYIQEDDSCSCVCGTSRYAKIRDLIDGADINGSITAFAKAQSIVEEIQGQCDCVDNH